MCFSPSASFGAGIVLSTIGIISIKKAETTSQKIFASIPLIFAIQQITEGFLWLSLINVHFAFLEKSTTYIFLFIAQVVWPFFVPFSILNLEENLKRKKLEKVLMLIGTIISLYLGYCLVSFPVEAKIIGGHVYYRQDYPAELNKYSGIIYIIATSIPSFFSSIKRMWILGITILISYITTSTFYSDYIVSVWCFFAALISVAVLFIILGMKRHQRD